LHGSACHRNCPTCGGRADSRPAARIRTAIDSIAFALCANDETEDPVTDNDGLAELIVAQLVTDGRLAWTARPMSERPDDGDLLTQFHDQQEPAEQVAEVAPVTDPAWGEARAEAVAAVFKIIAEADWNSPPGDQRGHRLWIAEWLTNHCGSRTLDAIYDIAYEVSALRLAARTIDGRPLP
jgi:hypothetical protein